MRCSLTIKKRVCSQYYAVGDYPLKSGHSARLNLKLSRLKWIAPLAKPCRSLKINAALLLYHVIVFVVVVTSAASRSGNENSLLDTNKRYLVAKKCHLNCVN